MGRGMGRATEMKMGTQYEYGDGGGHWDVGNEDSTEDGVGGGVNIFGEEDGEEQHPDDEGGEGGQGGCDEDCKGGGNEKNCESDNDKEGDEGMADQEEWRSQQT